jgi:hypothetical protein
VPIAADHIQIMLAVDGWGFAKAQFGKNGVELIEFRFAALL